MGPEDIKKEINTVQNVEEGVSELDLVFISMVTKYDFMSIVMYPDLKNRREFIHDSWIIAQTTLNEELKLALSLDPYFYLNRDDLLVLLQANDVNMITHLMQSQCNLHLSSDQGYKLIAIKKA